MQSHHALNAFGTKRSNGFGAVGSIRKEKIAFHKIPAELIQPLHIVLPIPSCQKTIHGSCRKVEDASDTHHGEATTGLLFAWLRELLLVGVRIHQADRSSIDRFEAITIPEVMRFDSSLDVAGNQPLDVLKKGIGEALSGTAEGRSIESGNGEIRSIIPALNRGQSSGA